MALQMRNKRNMEFSMASMSDLVFLLLIFFMLTSTLVSPNAIKLLLPNSESRTLAPRKMTVYINDQNEYYLETTYVEEANLQTALSDFLVKDTSATIVLKADKTVPIQSVVTLIDAVNKVNDVRKTNFKVILATKPNQDGQ